jgi:Radical SAM superfamily
LSLNDTFTSTGSKFFAHQEAMAKLRDGRGQPITTHVMLTDVCNHTCAFCSVQARAGDSLAFGDVMAYLDILIGYGLKSAILSGGGNPILYKCKKTGKNFNDAVDAMHSRGLEIGLITNGVLLRDYMTIGSVRYGHEVVEQTRKSWLTVKPSTLDKLTWVRISMAGLDHDEREVYVPDIDPSKTTLGFSYVAHDLYREPVDPHHGKVSSKADLLSGDKSRAPDWPFESRINELTEKITDYVKRHKPKYVRLLPNCLEPSLIPRRCEQLGEMARCINLAVDDSGFTEVAFVQNKPPRAPHACYLGYIHPVLNCDGYVYPCDSCVLNDSAGHAFANPWRVCHWSEIAKLYQSPVRSLIADPGKTCPGCVFTRSNELLEKVRAGMGSPAPQEVPAHVNFV